MAIKGHIYLVNDPIAFFAPIIVGEGTPSTGFAPASDAYAVVLTANLEISGINISAQMGVGIVSKHDGSFELPDIPSGFNPRSVSLNVWFYGTPCYRSEIFPYHSTKKELNIWIYEPDLPSSAGISAGQVSSALSGSSLPGDTLLLVTSSGFNVQGQESGVSLDFGVKIVPDTSPNLNIYFDLALNGWRIHVGFPASCGGPSANDVVNSIKTALQTDGSAANAIVTNQINSILEGAPFNLSSAEVAALIENVSIQFVSVSYTAIFAWFLSQTTLETVVISPRLAIGYPRKW